MTTPPSVKRRRYGASLYGLGYSPRIDDPFRRTTAQKNRDYPPLGSDDDDAIDPSLTAELPKSYHAYDASFDSIDDSLVPLTADAVAHHQFTSLGVEDGVTIRDAVQYDAGDEAEATLVENGSDQDSTALVATIKSSPKDRPSSVAAPKMSRRGKQKLVIERIIDFSANDDDDGEPFPSFHPVEDAGEQHKKAKRSRKKRKSEADGKAAKKSKSKRKGKKSKYDDDSSSDDDVNLEDLKRKAASIPQGYHPMFATYGYGVNPHDPRVQQILWPPMMQHGADPEAATSASMPTVPLTQPSVNGMTPPSHMAPQMPHMFDPQYMNAAMQMTQYGGAPAPWMMHPGFFPGPYPLAPQQTYQMTSIPKVEASETSAPLFSTTSTASHINHSSSVTSQLPRRGDTGLSTVKRTVKRGSLFSRRKPKRGSSKLKTVLNEQSDVPGETADDRYEDTEVDLAPFRPAAAAAKSVERDSREAFAELATAEPAVDTEEDSELPDIADDLNPNVKRKRGRPMGSKVKKRKDEYAKLKAMQERDAAEIQARQKKIMQAIDAVPRELMFDDVPVSDDNDSGTQHTQYTDATDAGQKPGMTSDQVLPAFLDEDDELDELEKAFNVHKRQRDHGPPEQNVDEDEDEASASRDKYILRERGEMEINSKDNMRLPRHITEKQMQDHQPAQPVRPVPALHPYLVAFDLSDDESPALLSRLRRGAVLPEPLSPKQDSEAAEVLEADEMLKTITKTAQNCSVAESSQQSLQTTCPDSMDEPLTQTQQSIDGQSGPSTSEGVERNPPSPLTFDNKGSSSPSLNGKAIKHSSADVLNTPDDLSLFVTQDNEEVHTGLEAVAEPRRTRPSPERTTKATKKQTTPVLARTPKSDQSGHSKTLKPIKSKTSTPSARRPLPSSPFKLQGNLPVQSSPLAKSPLNSHSLPIADPETPTEVPLTLYEVPDTALPSPEPEPAVRDATKSPENTGLTVPDIQNPAVQAAPITHPRVSPELSSQRKTLTPGLSKIAKRKSMVVEPPRRHSLLSLYDGMKQEAKAASAKNATSSTPSSSGSRRESRDRRVSKPAKAGNYRQLEKAQKAQARTSSSSTYSSKAVANKRKSMPAQLQNCGTEGYSCGNDFCFTCL